jgi:hypothetical protein
MSEYIRNYNKLFITKKYKNYIHDDENNDFKMIDFSSYENSDHALYLILNELYRHTEMNIFYYQKNIHEQLFYDQQNKFIIKRKVLFEQLQKFNLGLSRLKHLISIRFKKSKNDTNLYGEIFKKKHIELIEHGSKYKFDFFEMYNMVDSCFKHEFEGAPVILNIKNPYTNQNFSYYNIINIYFLLMNNERIPKYLYLYFQNNLSKHIFYKNYHFILFVDVFKYKYSHFTIAQKIKHIDRMLESHNYYSFIRNSQEFKLNHLSSIGMIFFIALKIINHYGTEYHDIYSRYIEDCQTKLSAFRIKHELSHPTRYIFRMD